MSYATRQEMFLLALAAPAFVAYARPPETVYPSSATIRIKGHGFSANDPFTFEVADEVGSLPTSVSETAVYYASPITSDLFRVCTVAGGTPIASWADPGESWGIVVDPGPRLDAILTERSAFIDEHLTAHECPIQVDPITGKYPPVLIGMCARLSARQAIASLSVLNQQYKEPIDRLLASEAVDAEILKAWKGGKPINPRPTDETTGTAENAARAQSSRAEMPWGSGMFS